MPNLDKMLQTRKRDIAIWRARTRGHTLEELGEKHGLTKQRIEQICSRQESERLIKLHRSDPKKWPIERCAEEVGWTVTRMLRAFKYLDKIGFGNGATRH